MSAIILLGVLMIFIEKILFAIEALLCRIVDILYDAFEMFAGITPVTYEGKNTYFLDVFFSNKVVSTVYWGMACIGFVMIFGFAIASMVRKMFDHTGEKVKATYGMILLNAFKAFLIILLLTAIVSATISATGVLLQRVDFLFDNAEDMANPSRIVFGDDDFATMFRIFDTIGNYSLNPSYDSRFNINSCFNAIRYDMQLLDKKGAFNFSYTAPEASEYQNNSSWQYALLRVFTAHDIYEEMPIDAYDENVMQAIQNCMYQIKTNKEFKPLAAYSEPGYTDNFGTTLGRTIMLSCSFECAKNSKYNKDPSVVDGLRRPYYVGDKNVFSYDQMSEDFDIGLFSWNHVVCLFVAIIIIIEMAKILINATARVFNIILLYLTAPAFVAVMPLDDGGKFKQWTTAFVIQSLSIFGSLFAVRLIMIFIPIILSPQLILFKVPIANMFAKLAFIIGICITAAKASGMISGILADNAGYQSIMAGQVADGVVGRATALAGRAVVGAAKLGFKVGTKALSGVGYAAGVSQKLDKAGEGIKNMGQSIKDKGLKGAYKSGFTTKEQDDKKKQELKEEAKERDTKEFRGAILDFMGNMSGGGGPKGGGQGGNQQGSENESDPQSQQSKNFTNLFGPDPKQQGGSGSGSKVAKAPPVTNLSNKVGK